MQALHAFFKAADGSASERMSAAMGGQRSRATSIKNIQKIIIKIIP
jgi:hypothetical protein